MTEDELRKEILACCERLGLLWHYCPDSRHCQGDKGFPDLFITGESGFAIWEIKSDDGETSPNQDQWLSALGGVAEVVRPCDYESGKIEKLLLGIL